MHSLIVAVAMMICRDIPGLIVIIATVQQWWKQTWCFSSHSDRGICHIWETPLVMFCLATYEICSIFTNVFPTRTKSPTIDQHSGWNIIIAFDYKSNRSKELFSSLYWLRVIWSLCTWIYRTIQTRGAVCDSLERKKYNSPP